MGKADRFDHSYISVFALAFGCIIGCGCFSMPGMFFIPKAGVVGFLIGLFFATLIALITCNNYIGLSHEVNNAGSSYQIIKGVFGKDHGFFGSWALLLTYLCVLFTNVKALAYIVRYLLGDRFLQLAHYTIMGNDVYSSDIFLSIALMVIFAFFVYRGHKFTLGLIKILSFVFIFSVVVLFIEIMFRADTAQLFSPAFSAVSDISNTAKVISIAVLSPWLFVGFETVSHIVPTYKLSLKKTFEVSGWAIIVGALMYAMVTLIVNAAVPNGFRSWEDLVMASDQVFMALNEAPPFYGIAQYLGTAGVVVFLIAVITAISGLILGYMMVSLHTIQILADDDLSFKQFRSDRPNGRFYGLLFIILVSLPLTFFGMNVAKWVMNVATLSISIVYFYISLGAFYKANNRLVTKVTGIIGVIFTILIFGIMLVPNSFTVSFLDKQEYMILSVWSLFGLICYRYVLLNDKKAELGKSMMTWILMFFLLFYSTNMWTHYQMEDDLLINTEPTEISSILTTNNLIRTIVIIIALIMLFELFGIMLQRSSDLGSKIKKAEIKNKAKNSMLSGMSHDIRTPLNAIVGFTDLALQDTDDPKKMESYLRKIKLSGGHLLELINDVLTMNQIDNGKLEFKEVNVNLPALIKGLKDNESFKVESKEVDIETDIHQMDNENVMCDPNRLGQALVYLIKNAIKYTPVNGKVVIGAMQLSEEKEGKALYEIFIRDGGQGMPEYLIKYISDRIEDADPTVDDDQGSGLGLALSKCMIDLMDGKIKIESLSSGNTEVYITIELPVTENDDTNEKEEENGVDLYGKRVLVVDDIMINRQIVVEMLAMYGMETEEAKDGNEAYEMVAKALPGHYDVILMDIQMPVMNGFESAKMIRRLDDPINAAVPIIAMTANAFDEDRNKAILSGMIDFVPKPIDREHLINTITKVFGG